MLTLITQHIKISWRAGTALLAVAFLFIAVMLFPFGIGAELILLRQIAPGMLWVVFLMSLMFSLEYLFMSDKQDGTLAQLFLLSFAPEFAFSAKLAGHFIAHTIPLLLFVPLAGFLLNLTPAHIPVLLLTLLCGAPALTWLGGLGAALSLASKRGALLTVIVLMPFYVPLLIIGAGASASALAGAFPLVPLLILSGISLAALLLVPWGIASALRYCE